MRVVVLGGGNSPERNVSLKSAKAVTSAIDELGIDNIFLDPIDLSVLDSIKPDDIVFPILHGSNGEDGTLQKELEDRGLAFLGSGSLSSENCFSKSMTRELLIKNSLPVAGGNKVSKDTYRTDHLSLVPHVLKASHGGSSIGTYIVKDPSNIDPNKVNEVFSLDEEAVIEELVEGVEITVPVLGIEALPVIEIRPPENQEFNYENKYNGDTAELCPAESISSDLQLKAQQLAIDVHNKMGCRHLSRTDMIVKPSGEIVILEINTLPGMTEQSLYPLSAKVYGLNFPELINILINMVKKDYNL